MLVTALSSAEGNVEKETLKVKRWSNMLVTAQGS
jgi:hypothetical protein